MTGYIHGNPPQSSSRCVTGDEEAKTMDAKKEAARTVHMDSRDMEMGGTHTGRGMGCWIRQAGLACCSHDAQQARPLHANLHGLCPSMVSKGP